MTRRIMAIAALGAAFATSALAQGGGSAGGAASSGPASGAPGTAPSGTAGVAPSATNPAAGTPGLPGPTSGAGIPGGSGPGTTVVAPNLPGASQSGAAPGRDSGAISGSPVGTASGGSRRSTESGNRIASSQSETSTSHPAFNPEAVTDRALDVARADIAAMSVDELRVLVNLLNSCTVNNHPAERTGACGAANKHYKARYAKERQIDRTLAELDRVVRFQTMFKPVGRANTDYEDRINSRLRAAAKTSLAAVEGATSPTVTRDASMPR
jgi:hypothetical protein